MDSQTLTTMIFGILGGLGIFLLGMKNMSEGMQAVAGNRLRKLINAITNNRLIACGVGTIATCLVQSSSITTVMVVGMVNAGIMNLVQAIGVILGANIGTTITGWILVIKIGKYGLPILGISALFYLFTKHERIRYTAGICLGLGMIFFGLQLMKNGFSPLKDMPAFTEWFARFSPTGYFGVLKCCLVGAVLTAIVQSSSATLAITMGLAYSGVIDFPTAAALVLGENIGTTITAYLASLGGSNNAKRASYAHIFVNVLGVVWITAIFGIYIGLVEKFIGSDMAAEVIVDGQSTFPNVMRGIATVHTGFNVVNVIIFLPLIGFLSKLLYFIVPEKPEKEEPHLTALDIRILSTPAISIQQSQKEIFKMSETVLEMMQEIYDVLGNQEPDEEKELRLFKSEDKLDIYQKEIIEFLSTIMEGNISHEVMNEGRIQLRISDELESVGDYITNILKLNLKMRDTGEKLSEYGLEEILNLHRQVQEYVVLVNDALMQNNKDILSQAQTNGNAITYKMKDIRAKHLERVGTSPVTPLKSLIYTDMLNAYRRIKDHALNIAEVIAGEK